MSGRSLCWCCLFFIWISLSSVVSQQIGGTLDCRVDGNTVTIELRIDHSVYPDVCPSTDGKPIFQSSPDGVLPYPRTECTVKEDIQSAACTFTPSSSDPCGCTGRNASIISVDYQFEHTPDINKWYTATIQCTLPPPQLSQAMTFPTCTVAVPTTTSETTAITTSETFTALPTPPTQSSSPPPTIPTPRPSATTPTPTPTTTKGGRGGSDLGKGVGIGVGVTLCVVVVVVAVMAVVLWRRGWVLPCAAAATGGEVAGDRPPAREGPAPTSPREEPSSQGEGNHYDGLVVNNTQSGEQRLYEGLRPLSDNPQGGGGGKIGEDSSLDPPQRVYQNLEQGEPPSGPPDSSPRTPQKRDGSETFNSTEASVDPDHVRVSMEEGDNPPVENVYENTSL